MTRDEASGKGGAADGSGFLPFCVASDALGRKAVFPGEPDQDLLAHVSHFAIYLSRLVMSDDPGG